MSIRYALLGLLAHTPRHGYDLKQAFEASFSQMRSLNVGQIYKLLYNMSAEGLVSVATVEQKNSPDKKVYSLTDPGRAALDEWLARPVEDNFEQVRSEFFVKLLVHALVIGRQDDGAGSRELVARQRQRFTVSMEELKRDRRRLTVFAGPLEQDPRPVAQRELDETRLLLIEGALLHLEADLQWLELIENRLTRLLDARRSLVAGYP